MLYSYCFQQVVSQLSDQDYPVFWLNWSTSKAYKHVSFRARVKSPFKFSTNFLLFMYVLSFWAQVFFVQIFIFKWEKLKTNKNKTKTRKTKPQTEKQRQMKNYNIFHSSTLKWATTGPEDDFANQPHSCISFYICNTRKTFEESEKESFSMWGHVPRQLRVWPANFITKLA